MPELADHPEEDVRETIVAPYRIIYEVDERRVLIHAVVDGRRDLHDHLLDRLA